ncbi:MAG: DUF5361 domain-containing protein [Faecousia sp.]
MIATDRDALVCDLAETYGIYDWKSLPVPVLATLSAGLREDSRIKMRMTGATIPRMEMLLAMAVDRLSLLFWEKTEDGRNGTNRPKSILSILLGEDSEKGNTVSFDYAEDYEAEWARVTGVNHG